MEIKEEILITNEGWLAFCPIWYGVIDDVPYPFPKYKLGWLLDAAIGFQQFLMMAGLTNGFVLDVKPLPEDKQFWMEI